MFFRVAIGRMVTDVQAVQRQAALETMLGSPSLAQVMGPDADLAKEIETTTALVCMRCATMHPVVVVADMAAWAAKARPPGDGGGS